jgi:HAD superfamily hydrolase (TIGR01458 family)
VPEIEGLLIDIDGVLAVSWQPINGAAEALAALHRAGIPMRFVTNTTSRTRSAVAAALAGAGLDVAEGEILTAPAATAAYLREHHAGARILLVNEGDLGEDLAGLDLVDANAGDGGPIDVVVLGGAGPAYSYAAVNRAFGHVLEGAPLVAMHRNTYWRTAEGLQLDTGAYVEAIAHAAGTAPVVLGKPDPAFFATALAAIGVEAADAAMIGDDLEADVHGGQAAGLTGVLVRTGKFRPDALARAEPPPDVVLDSFAEVPGWLLGR